MVKLKNNEQDNIHELFITMADCAPVLLWMSRQDSLCIFFNKTWLQFTGRTLEEEWGVGWAEGIHFEDFQRAMDTYIQFFNQQKPFEMEYRLRRYDGEFRWILDKGVPYYNKKGKFLGYIGSCIDITEKKRTAELLQKINIELENRVQLRTQALQKSKFALKAAKAKAEEATQLKSQFVSMVSHELKTPLTAIQSSLDLLMKGIRGEIPSSAKPLIEIAQRNAARLLRLIKDILDIEKIEAGKLTYFKKPQILLPLVKQAIASNTLYAQPFLVKFKLTKTLKNAKANVDSDRFIQVLDNILSNAAKFTRPNTTVTISMIRKEDKIIIAIKDEGKGISAEFAPKVFFQFTQEAQTTQHHGTGLGLNIAKSIIEQHKGTIYFKTSSKGTTFFIEIPEYIDLQAQY